MKEQQNTLLTLVVVVLTLVPIEEVTTTVPTIARPTASTFMLLTAISAVGLGSAYICRTER